MNENSDAKIVSAHARRVVENVLGRLVVKHTAPDANSQEMADLSLLGSDLPLALNEATHHGNPLIASLAAWMLMKLAETNGPYSPNRRSTVERARDVLVDAIIEEKPAVTLYALILLSNGGVPADAIPYLVIMLGHQDSAVAVYAASALSWCGESVAQAIPVLTKALHSDEDILGTVAASALGRLGLRSEEAVLALIRRLTEKASPHLYSVLLALRDLGNRASTAAAKLIAIARNRAMASNLRGAAAEALSSVDPSNPETKRLLTEFVTETDWQLIGAGIRGLAQTGSLGEEFLPRMVELLRSSEENQRRVAATAYRLLGPKAQSGLAELIEGVCREQNRDILLELATACALLGPLAAKPLCEIIQQGQFQRMGGACVALQLMGKSAAPEIALSLLSHDDEVVRRTSISLLRSLGADALPAMPVLIDMLPSLDDERAIDAIEVLANCHSHDSAASAMLISCLVDGSEAVSKAAGIALTELGVDVGASLTQRMEEASPEQRQRIESYLGNRRPVTAASYERLLALNADQDLLLFLFAAEVIERTGTIGLRKVANELEKLKPVVDLNLPASEASVRMMLANLSEKLQSPVNRQTTKGTSLSDEGRALLHDVRDYLKWRGFGV